MVSWAVQDSTDGLITYYGGSDATPYLKWSSSGTVDTQGTTRVQYKDTRDRFEASATLSFTAADQTPLGSTKAITMFFALARADQFAPGVVPTPAQIRALGDANLIMAEGTFWVDANDSMPQPKSPFEGYFGSGLTWPPNTKYWFLAMPSMVTLVGTTGNRQLPTVSIANYKPVSGQTENSLGRVFSFWTNRTPPAPTITSPTNGAVVLPGASFNLSFDGNDADEITSPSGTDPFWDDVAGVHVQYAARPSVDNPTPTWIDLPIGNNAGTANGPGWAIYNSLAPELPTTSGAYQLLRNRTIPVRASSSVPIANQGALPGGDWQIRIRTFDWGINYPNNNATSPTNGFGNPWGVNAAGRANLKPSLAPSTNTSPWSTPVNVSVPSQVPPPVPLSPTSNVALAEGQPVTLTYQYRNAAFPPFAQAHRLIQIRKVGDTSWTTLVNENSSSTSLVISGFTLVSTTFYEWRVQTTDTTNVVSDFSPVGQFWIVPAPASGSERPTPSSTIEGATLGCGKHTIEIFRRGGTRRVGVIRNVTHLDWGRVRDDISTAKVEIMDWDIDCGNLLASLQTWAYEVVITRDNGYSKDRVWEGPITLLTYERDKVTIQAKDVMGYGYRRIIRQAMNDSGKNTNAGSTVVDRAMRVLQNTFAPDDPNVLAYLQVLGRTDDAKQYRSTPAYSRTAFEEIDDMAANSGLDYTTVGRSILLWGTKHRIGTLPEFKDEDLGSPPIVSEYGMSMANVYSVSDGNGVYGVATRGGITETGGVVSGNDPIYGLVEMLSSSWASDSPDDTGTYTQAGLQTLIESFEGYAERSISDRYLPGAPVIVRVPDNTTLNPGTVISIQQLVPGVVIPLRSTGTLRTVVDSQKLDSVKVVEENGEETITITMSPFNRDDTDTTGDTE